MYLGLEALNGSFEPSEQIRLFGIGVALDKLKGQTAVDGINLGAEVGAGAADPIDHGLGLSHITVNNEGNVLSKSLVQARAKSAEHVAVLGLGANDNNNKTLTVAGVCGVNLVGRIVRILIGHCLGESQELTLIRVSKNTQFHFHAKILLDGFFEPKILLHFIVS